jgi:hypothetical protein
MQTLEGRQKFAQNNKNLRFCYTERTNTGFTRGWDLGVLHAFEFFQGAAGASAEIE